MNLIFIKLMCDAAITGELLQEEQRPPSYRDALLLATKNGYAEVVQTGSNKRLNLTLKGDCYITALKAVNEPVQSWRVEP